ncbi:glycosyl transferase family protein [mine drainage metagenome]|uniref:Endo-1,3-beta-glucanase btgC n=1 Tax=mine drainage metagenome TaxID=410659 RepID=T1AR85_9ZZZZ
MSRPRARFAQRHAQAITCGVLAAALLGGLLWLAALLWPVALPGSIPARLQCVSYEPFRLPGESPLRKHARISRARIDRDLAVLAQHFDCVRTYSVSQGLDQVPALAARHGMQVLLGIWIGPDARANAREIAHAIVVARNAPAGSIRAIVVGNEVLLRGDQPASVLLRDLHEVRAATGLPVTYADVPAFWLRHPELAPAVNFISVNMLPYWDNKPVSARAAVTRVARQMRRVQAAFPGKPVFISETGWPSAGRARRDAVPSRVNEALYLRGFIAWAQAHGQRYNLIEAFDQPWKRALEGTVGGSWGIYDSWAHPKFAWSGPVTEDPRAWWALLPLLLGAVIGAWRGGGSARICGALAGAGTGLALWALWRMAQAAAWNIAQWTYWVRSAPGCCSAHGCCWMLCARCCAVLGSHIPSAWRRWPSPRCLPWCTWTCCWCSMAAIATGRCRRSSPSRWVWRYCASCTAHRCCMAHAHARWHWRHCCWAWWACCRKRC